MPEFTDQTLGPVIKFRAGCRATHEFAEEVEASYNFIGRPQSDLKLERMNLQHRTF